MKTKTNGWVKYLLFGMLAIFIGQLFLRNSTPSHITQIGNKYISEKDYQLLNIINNTNTQTFYLFGLLADRHTINRQHPTFSHFPLDIFSIQTTDENVQQYINIHPLFQLNGKFSIVKYTEFLKQLSVTDNVFKQTVHDFLIIEQIYTIIQALHDQITKTDQYKKYANHINNAVSQKRQGYYQVIKTLEPIMPKISDREQVEIFYIHNIQRYMQQPKAVFECIKLSNISQSQWKLIAEDIQSGLTFNDLATKWNAIKIHAKVENQKLLDVHNGKAISDKFANRLLQTVTQAKPDQVNQILFMEEYEDKYLYKITDLTPAALYKPDYFTTTIWPSLNSTTPHIILKDWAQYNIYKQHADFSINTASSEPKQELSYTLETLQEEKDSVKQIAGKLLFTLPMGQKARFIYNNKIYVVTATKIEQIPTQADDKSKISTALYDSLSAALFNNILAKISQ